MMGYVMRRSILFFLFVSLFVFVGCAVNPVTGERELAIVSENQEISLGEKNYIPSRQMQGGDYVLDPALTRYVNEVGQRLVRVSDRRLPYEFAVLNNSVPNAWALPGGKLAVNRGLLLELKNEAELAAVLAHEIVHAAARHGAKGMERGLLLQGAILATGIAAQNMNLGEYVVGGAQVAAGLISTKYGRDAEREADYYGMLYMSRAGYDPRAAIGLQETFVRLSEGKEENWLAGLFASHPPSRERVAANRETARKLPPGGRLGTQVYQKQIGHLEKTKQAYEEFDKGRKALADKKLTIARSFAQKALKIESREAHFYALVGDVDFLKKQYKSALRHYDRAVGQPGDYFAFFLQRGLTHEKLGARRNAAQDLRTSVRLLPTATAFNALGNIELADGNRLKAKEYFQAAAGSRSEPGKQAFSSLVRLDLTDNPARYIQTRTGLSRGGYLVVELVNQTPFAVSNILLQVRYPDNRGVIRTMSQRIVERMAAGKSFRVQFRLGPFADPAPLRSVRATVIEARIADQR